MQTADGHFFDLESLALTKYRASGDQHYEDRGEYANCLFEQGLCSLFSCEVLSRHFKRGRLHGDYHEGQSVVSVAKSEALMESDRRISFESERFCSGLF